MFHRKNVSWLHAWRQAIPRGVSTPWGECGHSASSLTMLFSPVFASSTQILLQKGWCSNSKDYEGLLRLLLLSHRSFKTFKLATFKLAVFIKYAPSLSCTQINNCNPVVNTRWKKTRSACQVLVHLFASYLISHLGDAVLLSQCRGFVPHWWVFLVLPVVGDIVSVCFWPHVFPCLDMMAISRALSLWQWKIHSITVIIANICIAVTHYFGLLLHSSVFLYLLVKMANNNATNSWNYKELQKVTHIVGASYKCHLALSTCIFLLRNW